MQRSGIEGMDDQNIEEHQAETDDQNIEEHQAETQDGDLLAIT